MPLSSGTTLGPYAVTAKIGEGGMGVVYRARDTTLDRDVAIKVLPEAFATDAERLARFEREAKVLASLNHPNIAAIYGLERSGDTPALVLELVEGPTLADRIAQGPFRLDEALPIAKQIAEALEAAHEHGIIHRDLKPANIKVTPEGVVKVLDFGLAKALEPEQTEAEAANSPTMTAAATKMGVIMGTAAYMSPEQARGKTVDRRADIWAFGVVVYEMLTGATPFPGKDVTQTLARVVEREPDWETLPEGVPATLLGYLRRCFQKDPKQRVQAIGDMRLALEGAFETAGAPSEQNITPMRPVWQRPLLGIAGLALLLIGGLVGRGLTGSAPAPEAVGRFEIVLRAEETFQGAGRHMVALSPDGRHIVYNTPFGLSLRSLDQLTPSLIAGTAWAREPFFSPDGQWIGFERNGQLQKVSIGGGVPITLCNAGSLFGASWATNDMILYSLGPGRFSGLPGPGGIWRVPGTGGSPELVIAVDEGELVQGPELLPGAEWVLFTLRPAGASLWDEAQIVVQSLVTGERVVLIERGRDARYVPTGHVIYGLSGVLYAAPFDVSAREIIGGPVPIIEGVLASVATGAVQFSLASSGSLAYVPGQAARTTELVWVDRNGQERAIPVEPGDYAHLRVSPDGTRIALGRDLNSGSNPDIFIWHLEQQTLTRFTFFAGLDGYPVWTPDSSQIVFRSIRSGGGLFRKPADGTGEVEELLLSPDQPRPMAWVSDGRVVVQQQPGDIAVVTVDGTVDMLLNTDADERSPALSPDGRWLAFASDASGRREVYVRPFPNVAGGPWQVSTDGGNDPVWSPDGGELFFRSNATLMTSRVATEPSFTRGTPERLFSTSRYLLDAPPHRNYDVSPDGQQFVMAKRASGEAGFNGLIFVQDWVQELKERVPIN